jgi:hypothetical protein
LREVVIRLGVNQVVFLAFLAVAMKEAASHWVEVEWAGVEVIPQQEVAAANLPSVAVLVSLADLLMV